MAGESVSGVGQSADATRQQAAEPTSAETMLERHSGPNGLDTDALAAEVRANPQADASLVADLEARMTPVERGQFAAALDAANDNGVYSRTVAGETFEIGHPDAPDISSWGAMEPGTGYREAWDRTAAALGTTDAATITAELERQLYAPASTETVLDPIVVTATPPSEEGVGSFVEGAILGDFGDNSSWSATAGQVAMGFVPIAGQIADIRDTAAAISQVWNGEEGGWANLGTAALGWIPGIGDAGKAALRGGERLADASGEIAQTTVRRGDEAVEAARERIVMEGGRRGDWPAELNARTLRPNADYVVNGYSYRTDSAGRVTGVEGTLDLKTAERNGYQQSVSGREDRLPDDQGGHLIASIFNGPGDRVNLVPMNGNFNMGAWRRLEDRLADSLKEGRQVDVRIDVRYEGDTLRPQAFRVEYTIDGQTSREIFRNRPGG